MLKSEVNAIETRKPQKQAALLKFTIQSSFNKKEGGYGMRSSKSACTKHKQKEKKFMVQTEQWQKMWYEKKNMPHGQDQLAGTP